MSPSAAYDTSCRGRSLAGLAPLASLVPFGESVTTGASFGGASVLALGEGGGLEEEERDEERFASSLVVIGFSIATDESLELALELVDKERSRRRRMLL